MYYLYYIDEQLLREFIVSSPVLLVDNYDLKLYSKAPNKRGSSSSGGLKFPQDEISGEEVGINGGGSKV